MQKDIDYLNLYGWVQDEKTLDCAYVKDIQQKEQAVFRVL